MPNDRESKPQEGKGCLRCGYSVYEAEKLIAAGRVTIHHNTHLMTKVQNLVSLTCLNYLNN